MCLLVLFWNSEQKRSDNSKGIHPCGCIHMEAKLSWKHFTLTGVIFSFESRALSSLIKSLKRINPYSFLEQLSSFPSFFILILYSLLLIKKHPRASCWNNILKLLKPLCQKSWESIDARANLYWWQIMLNWEVLVPSSWGRTNYGAPLGIRLSWKFMWNFSILF